MQNTKNIFKRMQQSCIMYSQYNPILLFALFTVSVYLSVYWGWFRPGYTWLENTVWFSNCAWSTHGMLYQKETVMHVWGCIQFTSQSSHAALKQRKNVSNSTAVIGTFVYPCGFQVMPEGMQIWHSKETIVCVLGL